VNSLVVDASVIVKWLVQQPDSADAESVLASRYTLHAPRLARIETGNALWKHHLAGDLDRARYEQILDGFDGLGVQLHDETAFIQPAGALAAQFRRPLYDCLYLALAIRLDAVLVTADRRLAGCFAESQHAGSIVLLRDFAARA
jgi:predicted nucleic acid-binding protein